MASKEYEAVLRLLLEAVQTVNDSRTKSTDEVPVGISNRHVHLSQADLDTLFGQGYKLTPIKDLSQPGQFACKETVTIVGPKGAIEKVRVLGPVRGKSQIEILAGDGFKLGIKAPAKLSGDLTGTPGITIVGERCCPDSRRRDRGSEAHTYDTSRRGELWSARWSDSQDQRGRTKRRSLRERSHKSDGHVSSRVSHRH